MSREVEVTNISMVATTPEDIQISLGRLAKSANTEETSGKGVSLTNGTGFLYVESGKADNGKVAVPENDWDWSNIADISKYYAIGKLIPASSTSGANIFFTPDANGVGKTISSGAQFIQADAGVNNASGATDSGSTKGYKTTLHAFTTDNETWSGTRATAYNVTNDDGYFVDIPVWLRTSSTEGASLGVKAYVAPKSSTTTNNDGEALYRAVRVAILNGTPVGSGAAITPTGLLPVADGWQDMTSGSSGSLKTEPFSGNSILDWYAFSGTVGSGTSATGKNVAARATGNASSRFANNIYGDAMVYGNGTIVTLKQGTGQKYGDASQAIIRVWLEGEDPDCWNETAGQDWNIMLKFYNTSTNATSSNKDLNVTSSNS